VASVTGADQLLVGFVKPPSQLQLVGDASFLHFETQPAVEPMRTGRAVGVHSDRSMREPCFAEVFKRSSYQS
jgi:hypothetical protein